MSDSALYVMRERGITEETDGTVCVLQAVVRPSGGHAVVLNWSMYNIYGMQPHEVGRCHSVHLYTYLIRPHSTGIRRSMCNVCGMLSYEVGR